MPGGHFVLCGRPGGRIPGRPVLVFGYGFLALPLRRSIAGADFYIYGPHIAYCVQFGHRTGRAARPMGRASDKRPLYSI